MLNFCADDLAPKDIGIIKKARDFFFLSGLRALRGEKSKELPAQELIYIRKVFVWGQRGEYGFVHRQDISSYRAYPHSARIQKHCNVAAAGKK